MERIRIGADRLGQRRGLKAHPRIAELCQLAWFQVEDKTSALGFNGQEPFHLQPVDRLAHRRATDLQILGETRLGEMTAELQLAGNDPVAQRLGDQFGE